MNRRLIDFMAVISVLAYLEFNYLHFMGDINHGDFAGLWGTLDGFFIMPAVFLSLVSIVVRVSDRLSEYSIRKAFIITVSNNKMVGSRVYDNLTFTFKGDFSSPQHFISNEKSLTNSFNTVLKGLVKDRGSRFISPYIAIKVDLKSISDLEKKCLINSAWAAGALKAILIDKSSNIKEVKEKLIANPVELFE